MERLNFLKKMTILIIGMGNFYSVLFSPAKSFSLVLPWLLVLRSQTLATPNWLVL